MSAQGVPTAVRILWSPLSTTTEQQYDDLMDINVKGLFFSVQAVEPIMRPSGAINLNTSWLNQVGAPGRTLLSAAKATTRPAELLERRLRVNAIEPSIHRQPSQSDAASRESLHRRTRVDKPRSRPGPASSPNPCRRRVGSAGPRLDRPSPSRYAPMPIPALPMPAAVRRRIVDAQAMVSLDPSIRRSGRQSASGLVQDWAAERFTATRDDQFPPRWHGTHDLSHSLDGPWQHRLALIGSEAAGE
ncbi:SDR family oxidoreductase [Pseudomonas sp. Q1-7]|uniref:SDR family oxidoreductase n=1 Tax=Pseudomonas sp. Q1-7 TaxID=3020843 RepID=UPI0023019966|nr:SDR family oxidoreductase [Pseudomonas sp. Q1-7]